MLYANLSHIFSTHFPSPKHSPLIKLTNKLVPRISNLGYQVQKLQIYLEFLRIGAKGNRTGRSETNWLSAESKRSVRR